MNSHPKLYWAALPLMLLVTGCGSGNPLIKSVSLKSENIADKTYLQVDTEIGINLPELYPIVLPIEQVGSLTVKGRHVLLDINATDALRLHSCDGTRLPNGTAIPVTPPAGLSVACIPIGGSDSQVYVGFTGRQWLAGFALALKMRSPVRSPINVMLPIPMKNPNLQAVGGTFFGDVSGLAVFASMTEPAAAQPATPAILAASASSGEFILKSDSLTTSRRRALESAYRDSDDRLSVD